MAEDENGFDAEETMSDYDAEHPPTKITSIDAEIQRLNDRAALLRERFAEFDARENCNPADLREINVEMGRIRTRIQQLQSQQGKQN